VGDNPGRALLTLALVTAAPAGEGALFFLGLALTFALLAVVPTDEGRMRWPIILAGVLGVVVGIGAEGALNYVWPVALVGGRLYLILRALGSGRRPKPHAALHKNYKQPQEVAVCSESTYHL
jgi:hypothetical protein